MGINKKGQAMSQLGSFAVGLASLVVVMMVIFIVLAQGQSQIESIEGKEMVNENATLEYNATHELSSAVADVPGWIPLVVIVSIGTILIGMVSLFKRI